jgi:hypothetical protein
MSVFLTAPGVPEPPSKALRHAARLLDNCVDHVDATAGDERERAVTVAELWRRGQAGWPRRFPIAQFPNPPLLLAFAGLGVAAITRSTPRDVGRVVFMLGLAVWAVEEIMGGVNWFRRLLGVAAIAWIVVGLVTSG